MNWLQRLLQAPQNMLQQPQAAIPMMDNASMRIAQAAGTPNPNMPQMPGAMAPQQQTGLMDRFKQFRDGDRGQYLGDMFAGWAMGQTPGQSLGMGAAYAREGRNMRKGQSQEQDRLNQTVEYLKARGIDPDSAALMASSPQTLQEFLKQTLVPGQDKATEYGLNPIYATDPTTGETVLGTLGKDGSFKRIDTGGVQISTGVDKVDLGTHWGLLDKRSGQMVGSMPKENFEAARDTAAGTVTGKAEAEAQMGLGSTLQKAQYSMDLIDEMLKHPGLETATGLSSIFDPRNYMAGTDATNFNVRRKQLEGRAFLEAFESLKGGGQITQIEGEKATEAIARLSTAQSETAYKEALQELKDILEGGMANARKRAGGGQAPAGVNDASDPLGIRR